MFRNLAILTILVVFMGNSGGIVTHAMSWSPVVDDFCIAGDPSIGTLIPYSASTNNDGTYDQDFSADINYTCSLSDFDSRCTFCLASDVYVQDSNGSFSSVSTSAKVSPNYGSCGQNIDNGWVGGGTNFQTGKTYRVSCQTYTYNTKNVFNDGCCIGCGGINSFPTAVASMTFSGYFS